MSRFSTVWLFSDLFSRLPELIGGARAAGDKVNVFTLNAEQSAAAFRLGASQVWQLTGMPEDRLLEDYAGAMAETIRQQGDSGLLLLANTRRGALIAARLGSRLSAAIFTDITALSVEDDLVTARRRVYGGLAVADLTSGAPFCVVTVSVGAFVAVQPASSADGVARLVHWPAPGAAVIRTAVRTRESNTVALDNARLVVSVGRGIGSKQNIAIVTALCDAIGAGLACSRPVAENEKWMAHERYVGISNLMLKPELYLAVGISGQIQHMAGVSGARTIMAINKDSNAPIFQYADYGIVGDLCKIVPALTRQLTR